MYVCVCVCARAHARVCVCVCVCGGGGHACVRHTVVHPLPKPNDPRIHARSPQLASRDIILVTNEGPVHSSESANERYRVRTTLKERGVGWVWGVGGGIGGGLGVGSLLGVGGGGIGGGLGEGGGRGYGVGVGGGEGA